MRLPPHIVAIQLSVSRRFIGTADLESIQAEHSWSAACQCRVQAGATLLDDDPL